MTKIGIKLFIQVYEAGNKALRSIYKINISLLLRHGNADNITSCKASRDFIRCASNKTAFVELKSAFHQFHNDIDKEEVFDTLLN
jgi:alpha-beta hydrolase superfamily lysophospholipase